MKKSKFMPTIALSLVSMLSVCSAEYAVWDINNDILFMGDRTSTSLNYDKTFSEGVNSTITILSLSGIEKKATYNGNITLNGANLSFSYFNEKISFVMNGKLTIDSGSNVSNKDDFKTYFSYSGGTIELNRGGGGDSY